MLLFSCAKIIRRCTKDAITPRAPYTSPPPPPLLPSEAQSNMHLPMPYNRYNLCFVLERALHLEAKTKHTMSSDADQATQ